MRIEGESSLFASNFSDFSEQVQKLPLTHEFNRVPQKLNNLNRKQIERQPNVEPKMFVISLQSA